jgi:thioesterase domain-containing protein
MAVGGAANAADRPQGARNAAAEQAARAGDPTFGWGQLVSRVETFRIPGDHDEIVTRHIERIATTLEELLA